MPTFLQLACLVVLTNAALPPGPGPFGNTVLQQPVAGAARAVSADGWKEGKLCDVSKAPYSVKNGTNATAILQQAIEDCGNLATGGTVLVPSGLTLLTASLWLKSNLTLRVEEGATLLGTATGITSIKTAIDDAPMTYTRRNAIMVEAHAGFLNGGRCIKKKDPLVGWDDCAEWTKLANVAIEGGGTLDANGDAWYEDYSKHFDGNTRPMMLDLLWVDGLTVRDMKIRRPGYWTVHPCFSNNIRVTNNSIITTGSTSMPHAFNQRVSMCMWRAVHAPSPVGSLIQNILRTASRI
jgi:polygalacturonase